MADYQYVTLSGVIVPDTATLQATVEDEYRAVFGVDLIVTPDTPQGVLITAEVLARDGVVRNNAALANQINPNLAGGVFLDAIWALTGGARLPAVKSVIPGVELTGVAGTVVPAGSVASVGVAGVQFASSVTVTLDLAGEAIVDFVALEAGPVAVVVGDLDTVVSAVLGWETVTNPTAATIGALEESDVAARRRRRNTLALQGSGGPEAIISGLYAADGVRSLTFRENVTAGTLTIDGVSMVAHSIYACIDGGTDIDIANTLIDVKSMGAAYNGSTTVVVTSGSSGQTYTVKFDRPDLVPVRARVSVTVAGFTGDPTAAVKQAILDFAAGLVAGQAGFVVGASVSPFELAGAVNIQAPGLYVQKVEVCTVASGVFAVAEIPLSIQELATIADGDILVILL